MSANPLSSSSFNPDVSPLASNFSGTPVSIPATMATEILQTEDIAKPILHSAAITAEPVKTESPKPHTAKDITKDVAAAKEKTPEEKKAEEEKAERMETAQRMVLATILTALAVASVGLGVILLVGAAAGLFGAAAFPPVGVAFLAMGLVLGVGALEALKPPKPKKPHQGPQETQEKKKPEDKPPVEEPTKPKNDAFSIEVSEIEPGRAYPDNPDEPNKRTKS